MMFSKFKRQKTAEAYYNNAIDLYEKGQYEKALSELKNGEALDSSLHLLYYQRGLCYQKLEKFEEAKHAFQQSLSLYPDDPDCLYNLARLFYNEGKEDTALSYAEQAEILVGEPGDELIAYLLGLIYEHLGQYEEAARAYEKSLELNPNQVLTGIFLSKIYVYLQDYQKAITLLKEMAEQDSNNLDVNYELSMCLAKAGEWEETIRYCKRVIEIDPKYTKGYNQLGLAMYCTERLQEAIDYYEQALKIDASYTTALNNLAYTYEKMQQFDKAIEKFSEYLSRTEEGSEEHTGILEHIEILKRKLG